MPKAVSKVVSRDVSMMLTGIINQLFSRRSLPGCYWVRRDRARCGWAEWQRSAYVPKARLLLTSQDNTKQNKQQKIKNTFSSSSKQDLFHRFTRTRKPGVLVFGNKAKAVFTAVLVALLRVVKRQHIDNTI